MVLDFDQLERFVRAELFSRKHPGSSVAIVSEDEIVWTKGFGYSNMEEKVEATPDTIYRCASITKPVVTTGLLQLYERGRFALDDPVNDHLDVKIQNPYPEEPTMRDLLTHYTGMPVRVGPISYDDSKRIALAEYLEEAARTVRPRGEKWMYCNTAFNIVGYLIKLFTSKPYTDYCRERVLRPLEMTSSDFDIPPSLMPRMAQGYGRDGGPEKPLYTVPHYISGTDPPQASGSLISTVKDLANFVIAQLNDGRFKGRTILKHETLKEMQGLQAATGSSRSGMGLSWFRAIHYGRVTLSHSGSVPGFTNHLAFFPMQKLGIVWLSNLNNRSAWRPPVHNALHTLIRSTDPGPRTFPCVPEEWERVVGTYGDPESNIRIAVKSGLLTVERPDTAYLLKVGDNRYQAFGSLDDGFEVTVEHYPDGYVKQLDLKTSVIPRYTPEKPRVDEDAELTGTWKGELVHPYGFYPMELVIESSAVAKALDMRGEYQKLREFRAEKGRVTGVYCNPIPEGYVGWATDRVQSKLDLHASGGELTGVLSQTSPTKTFQFTTRIKFKRG